MLYGELIRDYLVRFQKGVIEKCSIQRTKECQGNSGSTKEPNTSIVCTYIR